MGQVSFSTTGENEIAKVFRYLAGNARDAQEYSEQAARIISELQDLASKPMLGERVSGLESTNFRYWLIVGNRYRVYFDRTGPDSIEVGLIRRASASTPDATKVRQSF